MNKTLWPSAVHDEISALESELKLCLDLDTPIDTIKLKRLSSLRLERLKELVDTHAQRMEVMQQHTREMTDKLSSLKLDGKPDVKEHLFEEQEKYDKAANHWVISETSQWGESEAASIAAGILMLVIQ